MREHNYADTHGAADVGRFVGYRYNCFWIRASLVNATDTAGLVAIHVQHNRLTSDGV
jgi:uncharacterized membrane protein